MAYLCSLSTMAPATEGDTSVTADSFSVLLNVKCRPSFNLHLQKEKCTLLELYDIEARFGYYSPKAIGIVHKYMSPHKVKYHIAPNGLSGNLQHTGLLVTIPFQYQYLFVDKKFAYR